MRIYYTGSLKPNSGKGDNVGFMDDTFAKNAEIIESDILDISDNYGYKVYIDSNNIIDEKVLV